MNIRLTIMIALYNSSQKIYTQLFKQHKLAWNIRKEDFLSFPKESLGYHLGLFYHEKGFDVIPKLENHDVFHVITDSGTEIQDEVAMQYLLLGNGKISLYQFAMIGIGTCIYPEYFKMYLMAFSKGNTMQKFYDLDFENLLKIPLHEIKSSLAFDLKKYLNHHNLTTL
ncbi:Coq4 family protein [Sphingobacterium sp. SG20118]|uniref:Coq4 family protein n=1 Tax=Sphingobacterium sp. SG20118 TaxID=3367156 RepID=UPI0037DFC5A2